MARFKKTASLKLIGETNNHCWKNEGKHTQEHGVDGFTICAFPFFRCQPDDVGGDNDKRHM